MEHEHEQERDPRLYPLFQHGPIEDLRKLIHQRTLYPKDQALAICHLCMRGSSEDLRDLVDQQLLDPTAPCILFPHDEPLAFLAQHENSDAALECGRYLISVGARIKPNVEGDHALDFAIQFQKEALCVLLLPLLRELPPEQKRSRTLCSAILSFPPWLLRSLISDYGFDPNNIEDGESALCYAVTFATTEYAAVLIELGADINLPGFIDMTPLARAASSDQDQYCPEEQRELMAFLIRHGADLDIGGYSHCWTKYRSLLDEHLAEVTRRLDVFFPSVLATEIASFLRPILSPESTTDTGTETSGKGPSAVST